MSTIVINKAYWDKKSRLDDKLKLEILRSSLGVAKTALVLDDSLAWCLKGRHGHIYTFGPDVKDGYLLVRLCGTPRRWDADKRRLDAIARVTQDGDDEGAFHLAQLPTSQEAIAIRKVLGLRKSREAPAYRGDLSLHGFSMTGIAGQSDETPALSGPARLEVETLPS